MLKKLKITLLTDKSSWMNEHNISMVSKLKEMGHSVKIISDKNKIEKGDILFLLSCFELISKEKLSLNTNNIVVHASDLPEGKGWSPSTWQIIEGKNKIPITLFEANENCDSGDYYIKDKLILDGFELIDEWQKKLGKKIVEMCILFVEKYGSISPQRQSGKETFYPRRHPKDSRLDINKTIKEQFNLLRVADNNAYPAYFKIGDIKYLIKIEKDKTI